MNIFEQLKQQAEPLMEAFQGDLEHDRAWIERNPGEPFIHVTRRTGTHIVAMPKVDCLRTDEEEPYLFGVARPSEIYRQTSKLLRGQVLKSGVLWLVYDGKQLKPSNHARCVELYERSLRSAQRRAKQHEVQAA